MEIGPLDGVVGVDVEEGRVVVWSVRAWDLLVECDVVVEHHTFLNLGHPKKYQSLALHYDLNVWKLGCFVVEAKEQQCSDW